MSVAPSDFARALQEARLARSLSVLDAAQAMRLSDKQISGLEHDDHASFYSAVYAERAATNYVKFLNVPTTLIGGPPYEDATPPPLVASVATVPAAPPTRQRLTSPSAGLYGAVGVVLAGIIIAGTTYNSARLALSERGHEFASLCVLGYGQRDVAALLLGEQSVSDDVSVRIGAENPVEELRTTSVVSMGYGTVDNTVAHLGVLGPTRMDYAGSMSAVRAVARYLGRILMEQ